MARDNDATDRRLLALLQMNARESVATLSRKLGIARTTVQERISRMERNGTIAGYSVVLRRDPFNQYAEAVVLLSVAHRKIKAVIDQLREFPEAVLCQATTGEFELICRIRVAHLEDVQPVLEGIGEIAGVERVRSIMVLSTAFDHSHTEPTSLATKQATALGRGELG
jgi:DNA-binding Lrp family transcriptional regulator